MTEWIELLGNLGEFVGSIAVLATLVYLAVQVRQTRDVVVASTHQARSDSGRDITLSMAASAELAELNT